MFVGQVDMGRPSLESLASLAIVPGDVASCTYVEFARDAGAGVHGLLGKLVDNLAMLTGRRDAPSEAGNGLHGGPGGEFVVAFKDICGGKGLDVGVS